MNKYAFRHYHPEYSKFFTLEKKRVQLILSFAEVEHIGSTAIRGLSGKGILDISIGVPKNKLLLAKKILQRRGYEFRAKASTKQRFFFRRDCPYKRGIRRVHLHLTKLGGKDWREMLFFRNYLRKNPKARQEYVNLKKEAVRLACGVGELYRKHKQKFIQDILQKQKLSG
ncbi:GrpB family protein [Candidatus Woesearchaeota archaeon]|nr:GrpB family protein [Candidatus Woesearchaeota archaeon]